MTEMIESGTIVRLKTDIDTLGIHWPAGKLVRVGLPAGEGRYWLHYEQQQVCAVPREKFDIVQESR